MHSKKMSKLVKALAVSGLVLGGLIESNLAMSPKVQAAETINKNFLVYYRAWRDKEMQGVNTSLPDKNWITMDDIPYGINIVNVFSYVPEGQEAQAQPFFDKLKTDYAPNLHARGVKLIRGFDYSKLLAVPHAGDFPTEAEFDAYAQQLINELMKPWGLDGLDIDMETTPSSDQIKLSDGVIKALSKYLGPKANNGTLFLYDTNGSNVDPFKNVSDCFDQLAYQQYGSDEKRTAKAVSDYAPYISKNKFMPGLAFPEEQDHNRWYDTKLPYETSNIFKVANYVKQNNLSGMFLYALDRDGKTYDEPDINTISPSNLLWTKTAILEVNGWSLDSAKQLAKHQLQRISYAKDLDAQELKLLNQKVDEATNLLDVNAVVLGYSYDQAINATYDPVLENQLSQIDLQPAYASLDQAQAILAKQSKAKVGGLQQLQAATEALAQTIATKSYTQDDVTAKTTALNTQLNELTGTITVHFQDTNGNKLADDMILHGKMGENYQLSAKKIDGYHFQKVIGSEKGIFGTENQEVTYVYTKAQTTKQENKTQAKLPQTGEHNNVVLTYVGAILVVLVGVFGIYRYFHRKIN